MIHLQKRQHFYNSCMRKGHAIQHAVGDRWLYNMLHVQNKSIGYLLTKQFDNNKVSRVKM